MMLQKPINSKTCAMKKGPTHGCFYSSCCVGVSMALMISLSCASAFAQQSAGEKQLEVMQIFANQDAIDTATGSATILNEAALEEFEFDDIHRVLQSVPGVYIREEDGYGLRPNIGLRGATSERSSKIALMEDGVLLSPAPYAAPAAYFFPLVSRMSRVEVFKGPSAILYGPNTVGGALNMVSRGISAENEGEIDLAAGQQDYRKVHGYFSAQKDEFAVLIEGINLHADGFKTLPNGDDSGFAKNEVIAKLRYVPKDSEYNQHLELKLGYADEVSNETYLGTTDADFAIAPYERYAASQNDKLDWEHYQIQLSHYMDINADTILFTQAYRRDFDRDWDRLNGFAGNRSIETVLNSPETGLNALFLQVLKGDRDSLTADEALQFTLNDRQYYSQGVQSKLIWDGEIQGFAVNIEVGLRFHQDQVERLHRQRFLNMQDAELILSNRPESQISNNQDTVTAIASYVNSTIQLADLTVTGGVRVEYIDGEAIDNLTQTRIENQDTVVLPGIGAFYQLSPTFGILAGLNKGFVPNSPGQTEAVDPEESWNYELGLRASFADWKIESIGFYNDYSNLKGTCTFSNGCTSELDQEFNGGEVEIYGLEFSAKTDFEMNSEVSMPINITYTFTESEFKNSFLSGFSQWGNISAGDELPYLPTQQLNIQWALRAEVWQVALSYKYVAEMLEASGLSTELAGVRTSSLSQFDLSAHYQVNQELRLYAKVDNLTDEVEIVSRRPFGARPGKPQQVIVGMKYAF
jgi:Fe(3+) dicitrate transport protein